MNTTNKECEIETVKRHILAIFTFLVAAAVMFGLLDYDKEQRIGEYLKDSAHTFDAEYHTIYRSFEEKAQIVYDTLVDRPEVKRLFAQRDRTGLNRMLQPEYRRLKHFGVKQFHFHLPNNHSFLRLHKPDLYGDDLSGFRETVRYVNTTHRPIGGFEEGIASNGFRFVFPLFYRSSYIGSVEISFDAYSLADYLKSDFIDTRFIINKKVLLHKKGRKIQTHYRTCSIDDDFVTERTVAHKHVPLHHDPRLHLHHTDPANASKPFALDERIAGDTYVANFIPVLDPITHTLSAYLVVVTNGKYIAQIQNTYLIVLIISWLAMFLLLTRYIRDKDFADRMRKNNRKLQTILDSLDTMILITDGKEMIDVNRNLLDFFGFESIEELKKSYTCICDFFVHYEGYFHTGLVPEGGHWIDEIRKLPEKQRIVNIIGKDMEAKAFGVKIESYDVDENYIISFTDMTDMIIEQRMLEYKATHDKLTDIYNRQKLDETFATLCRYSHRRKEPVGVIMFDIDHFKKINDTYGHDTGDKVLREIAKLVKKSIRDHDIFGRWGGEEFMLILRYATAEETYLKARFLRRRIAEIDQPGIPRVTASFGVTTLDPSDTVQSLTKRVDEALYQAKHSGRNCVVHYSLQMEQA